MLRRWIEFTTRRGDYMCHGIPCRGHGFVRCRHVRAPSQFQNIRFQKRWKFLFIKYRPGTHWWSFVHLAKGVVLIAGYVILKTGLGMLSWIMFGLVAYLMLVIGFRPWRHAIVNGMESLPQTSPILCVALALFWAERDIQMDHDLAVLGASLTGECRYMSEQKCIDRFKQVLILVCLSSRIRLIPGGEFMATRMAYLVQPCPTPVCRMNLYISAHACC